MFRSKFVLIALAAVALIFGSMQLSALQYAAEVEALNGQVEQLQLEKATKQAEVDTLAQELELSDFTLKQLLSERESISAIRAQADAEAERLRTALADAYAQVDQLRVSNDAHIKHWANAAIPVAAVCLLDYADKSGCNTDGNSLRTGLSGAATGHDKKLSTRYQL